MPTRAEIVQVVEAYLTAVNDSDVEGAVALFAADARQEDPVGSEPNIGHDAIRAFFTASAEVEMSATRYGPVCVMGNQALFQLVIEMPMGEDVFRMLFTDHITLDEAGRIAELRGWNDAEADLTDAPGARRALGVEVS